MASRQPAQGAGVGRAVAPAVVEHAGLAERPQGWVGGPSSASAAGDEVRAGSPLPLPFAGTPAPQTISHCRARVSAT